MLQPRIIGTLLFDQVQATKQSVNGISCILISLACCSLTFISNATQLLMFVAPSYHGEHGKNSQLESWHRGT